VSPALARYELARALAESGREGEARAQIGRLKLPDEAPPDARVAVGQLAYRLGETALALTVLEEALRRDPSFAPAHEALGVVLEASGRHPEAVAHLAEACRLDPASPTARVSLAVLMARDSRLAEARQLLREALEVSPGYEPAERLLVELGRTP
jgi:Flp pilus assembly protein TadD